MRNVAGPSITIAGVERFLHVPSRKVRGRDVADFAFANKLIERTQCLVDGSERVETVHVIDVDVVSLKALQAAFDLLGQVRARRPEAVRPLSKLKGRLGRNQNIAARQMLDRLAEDL